MTPTTCSQIAEASKLGCAYLFYNNDAPTELEKVSLREGILSMEQGVENIDEKVAALLAQRALLDKQLVQHRTALAPVRHLPADVLHEVFEFLGRGDLSAVNIVCRKWHEASIAACLKEWSTLSVSFTSENIDMAIAKMRRWRDRTGKLGKKVLSIRYEKRRREKCACHESFVGCPWQESDLTALLKSIPLLSRLSLDFPYPSCFVSLFKTFQRDDQAAIFDFPAWTSLHSLNLKFLYDVLPGPPTQYQTILKTLPGTLTNLTLRIGSLLKEGDSPPTFDIPDTVSFALLRTLRLECEWDTSFILSFLSRCTGVERLSLDFGGARYTWSNVMKELVLPNVHTLCLKFAKSGRFDKVLRFLRLPAITSLSIDSKAMYGHGRDDNDIVWEALEALILVPSEDVLE